MRKRLDPLKLLRLLPDSKTPTRGALCRRLAEMTGRDPVQERVRVSRAVRGVACSPALAADCALAMGVRVDALLSDDDEWARGVEAVRVWRAAGAPVRMGVL